MRVLLPTVVLAGVGCRSPTAVTFSSPRPDASATGSSSAGDSAPHFPPPLPDALPFDAAGCIHPPVAPKCSGGFCEIPAGCFVMGSPENEPERGVIQEQRVAVTITRPFLMQEHETTQAEWTAAALPNPSGTNADGSGDCLDGSCPIGNVTWFEAVAYANLLSERHKPPLAPCYELSDCTGELGKEMKCTAAVVKAPTIYDSSGEECPRSLGGYHGARCTGTGATTNVAPRRARPGHESEASSRSEGAAFTPRSALGRRPAGAPGMAGLSVRNQRGGRGLRRGCTMMWPAELRAAGVSSSVLAVAATLLVLGFSAACG